VEGTCSSWVEWTVNTGGIILIHLCLY